MILYMSDILTKTTVAGQCHVDIIPAWVHRSVHSVVRMLHLTTDQKNKHRPLLALCPQLHDLHRLVLCVTLNTTLTGHVEHMTLTGHVEHMTLTGHVEHMTLTGNVEHMTLTGHVEHMTLTGHVEHMTLTGHVDTSAEEN